MPSSFWRGDWPNWQRMRNCFRKRMGRPRQLNLWGNLCGRNWRPLIPSRQCRQRRQASQRSPLRRLHQILLQANTKPSMECCMNGLVCCCSCGWQSQRRWDFQTRSTGIVGACAAGWSRHDCCEETHLEICIPKDATKPWSFWVFESKAGRIATGQGTTWCGAEKGPQTPQTYGCCSDIFGWYRFLNDQTAVKHSVSCQNCKWICAECS